MVPGKLPANRCCAPTTRCIGLPYVAFRYFNVYGPRMDMAGVYTEVLIRWLDAIEANRPPLIFGDGTQSMDFVYVADVARANILAAQSDVTDEVFNVGTGKQTSLSELCDLVLRLTNSPMRPEYREARKVANVQARRAATEKASKLLGFEAKVSLADGSGRTHPLARERQGSTGCCGGVMTVVTSKTVPVARPSFGIREEKGRRRRSPERLGQPGTPGCRIRAALCAVRRRGGSSGRLFMYYRPSPGARGCRDSSGRRGAVSQLVLHRYCQCHCLRRGPAGIC